jgi:hypothetical protein
MSNRSRREAASRAEARRRARRLERGDEPDESEEQETAGEDAPAGQRPGLGSGLLGRLFPPAPPLPGRADPLAAFDYQGPFRSVAAAGYLVGRNPRAWLLPGLAWAVAQTVAYLSLLMAAVYSRQFDSSPPSYSLLEIATLLVSVFAVIAAGWLGWQRPWLFGLAAVVAGTFIQALALALLISPSPLPGTEPASIFASVTLNQILQLQWALGALIGWYGGYLRRRMAVTPPAQPQRRRR